MNPSEKGLRLARTFLAGQAMVRECLLASTPRVSGRLWGRGESLDTVAGGGEGAILRLALVAGDRVEGVQFHSDREGVMWTGAGSVYSINLETNRYWKVQGEPLKSPYPKFS